MYFKAIFVLVFYTSTATAKSFQPQECSDTLWEEPVSLSRIKRQAKAACQMNQWPCADGSCISIFSKCDGIEDCPDGSDETFVLCRKTPCQPNWFRCTYGACVERAKSCNKVKDCADNSDELLRRCRNQEEISSNIGMSNIPQFAICDDGRLISSLTHCDGAKDCADGSDETLKECAGKTCPSHLFQCAYGACIDQGSVCNNKKECADGSDEFDDLCNRTSTAVVAPGGNPLPDGGACQLPPYPKHGTYVVLLQVQNALGLNITCDPGYGLVGPKVRVCFNGNWAPTVVTDCERFCRVDKDPSVQYRCLLTGDAEGSRECDEYEPDGTVIHPKCNSPNYYYPGVLSNMRCIKGRWDYVARCDAECGRVVPKGVELTTGGRPAEGGELPWHANVYKKTATYMHICGGSLVSTKLVISGAHCFWSDKLLPAKNYAVALGNLYRPWDHMSNQDVQRSDVADIKVPPRFLGSATNFQADIALVLLATVIEYKPHIRPICVDFNIVFENRQLSAGNNGKAATWSICSKNGIASQEEGERPLPSLKVVELPYIPIEECLADSPPDFREYITGDKICAGYRNGTALICRGDSGGGLAFPDSDRGIIRYYLRGIISTAPNDANWLIAFTQLSHHEHFIKRYL